jgi:hypothetical protein
MNSKIKLDKLLNYKNNSEYNILPNLNLAAKLRMLKHKENINLDHHFSGNQFIDVYSYKNVDSSFDLPDSLRLKKLTNNFSKLTSLNLPALNQIQNVNQPQPPQIKSNKSILPSIMKPVNNKYNAIIHRLPPMDELSRFNLSSTSPEESTPSTVFADLPMEHKKRILNNNTVTSINNNTNSSFSDYHTKSSIRTNRTNDSENSQVRSPIFQLNSNAYFWYYREKSKLFSNENSPTLLNYSPIHERSRESQMIFLRNATSERNLKEMKHRQNSYDQEKILIEKKLKISLKDVKEKQKQLKDKNNNKKTEETDKKKSKKDKNKKLAKARVKRASLSSAQLRDLSVSEKFIKEAKSMVYVPHTNSLFPIKAYEYLAKAK